MTVEEILQRGRLKARERARAIDEENEVASVKMQRILSGVLTGEKPRGAGAAGVSASDRNVLN
jgi:hypothetical protein